MTDLSKSAMRRAYRAKRDYYVATLAPFDRSIAFSRAPTALRQAFAGVRVIAGYVPIGSEADPTALLEQARAGGADIALPHVTSRSAPMRFLLWSPDMALEAGPFGLLQPAADCPVCQPDVVLVPLLAFDARMMRLGQGAGHYDRALSQLAQATAVGIAWSVQQAPEIPADAWDVPMHAVLTEKAWMTP